MIWSLFLPAFLASVVECVEALTIVLAIGTSINWKSSLSGVAAGLTVLAVLIAVLGSTILYVPIDILRMVIGVLLVLFGLQWLEKAILRYTGLKAKHDEGRIYEKRKHELDEVKEDRSKFSKFGFLTSFKGVVLEGLEIAVIVITFGSTGDVDRSRGIITAGLGAALALLLVTALGIVVRKPLANVPENTFKFFVGIMLVTFGAFLERGGVRYRLAVRRSVPHPAGRDLSIIVPVADPMDEPACTGSKNERDGPKKVSGPATHPVGDL